MRLGILVSSCVALVALGACSPNQAYCDKYYECFEKDRDLEDDYVAVCTEAYNAADDVLRANEEEDCHQLAEAKNRWMACMAQLDCNDFEDEFQNPDECEDEFEDLEDAYQDAGNDCGVTTYPTGEQ